MPRHQHRGRRKETQGKTTSRKRKTESTSSALFLCFFYHHHFFFASKTSGLNRLRPSFSYFGAHSSGVGSTESIMVVAISSMFSTSEDGHWKTNSSVFHWRGRREEGRAKHRVVSYSVTFVVASPFAFFLFWCGSCRRESYRSESGNTWWRPGRP